LPRSQEVCKGGGDEIGTWSLAQLEGVRLGVGAALPLKARVAGRARPGLCELLFRRTVGSCVHLT